MVAMCLGQRAAAFLCLATITCLLALSSDASDDRPSFPHLEPRFEALNITSGDEVKNLVRDWQAELNTLNGPGGQGASLRLPENKVLERRFAWPFLAERANCIEIPLYCAYQYNGHCCLILTERATCIGATLVSCASEGNSYCCYTSYTCCNAKCCVPGYSCCNNNLGLCCGSGQFCCNLNVCCNEGQICSDGTCFDTAVYVTATITSFSTQYSTTLQTIIDFVTSTVQSTIISLIVNTVSNVATASLVIYVTSMTTTMISAGANGKKRTASIEVPITFFAPATESVTQKALDLKPPKLIVGSDKKFDVLAEKLSRRGLVVERAVTITRYITSYFTINSVHTSTISPVQTFYITSLTTNFITSTLFLNAQVTADVTSTIVLTVTVQSTTSGINPTGGSNPASNSTDNGLSTGAMAGIIIGTVVGLAAIAVLAFALWRRSRRGNDLSNIDDAVSNQPHLPTDPAKYPGRSMEMTAVGVACRAAAQDRDSRYASGHTAYAPPHSDAYSTTPSSPPPAYDPRVASPLAVQKNIRTTLKKPRNKR